MRNIFSYLLDLCSPKQNFTYSSVFQYLSDVEIDSQNFTFKDLDLEQSKYIESIFVASSYHSKIIRDLILRAKFSGETSICKDLGRLIYKKIQLSNFPRPDLIVPVPADPKRLLIRGFHLPYILADKLSVLENVKSVSVFYKAKNTLQQILLDRENRLYNLNGCFILKKCLDINFAKYSTVWIVDDLTTTGSTLVECAKVLKLEYPFLKIYGVVVASN